LRARLAARVALHNFCVWLNEQLGRPRLAFADLLISQGLWRIARLAQDAAESLDGRIQDEELDGMAEAVEVREALERLQTLSLEVSEVLDANQTRHGG
jgi:hypothetical protein